ncbi:type IV pilus biogenesis/stability protein PilW [Yersinia pseudotuberculosis IP 32953]|uniref:Type IV pilus biogenesis/stability protein PilW n=4 Tax=Yersinia pseudotuberculosis complex TaxID=1649845 RepID=A0ABN5R676_YERPU|nr:MULTISPECIES: type IV pilus biogenesis/stability protein PilW [Yersinia pseudotuberculosis complex]CQD48757.1 putative fimbrial biogenesis protein [Yersinia intermedia]ABS47519.1 type IV pilus biogenesis/stability protein PilW [Yersinia pseudotuberculosis IP 31758]AIN13048.1 type IV pilus biogenesis/stability protein PilW [Yersinia pseudotuberculosis]AJJ04802.1 type IV pilus biogenesis/stability protein PilW [Yersinia pseudotuberculosis]AJJ05606.1 type IV pilus biogenesis/stability protein 
MKLTKLWRVCLVVSVLTGCSGTPPENTSQAVAGQTRLQLGLAYLAQGDLTAARKNLEKAVEADPQDYRTQLGMAFYAQRIGENSAAEQRYQQAMKLAPGNGTVLNNYGAFLCSLGQYVSAQQQFSAAALLPDYGQVADSLENAGYCFLRANQDKQARVLLSRALKYDPDKGEPLLAEAQRYFGEGNRAQAQLLLDVYQHTLPASAESLWLQIRFAALAGRQDSVQRYGKQLARSFPQSKQYQHFLANEY